MLFRSWNRAAYTWNPVIKVAAIGDNATYFHDTLSLAYDSSTATFAIFTEYESAPAFASTHLPMAPPGA